MLMWLLLGSRHRVAIENLVTAAQLILYTNLQDTTPPSHTYMLNPFTFGDRVYNLFSKMPLNQKLKTLKNNDLGFLFYVFNIF
jgi:hypothetical protein